MHTPLSLITMTHSTADVQPGAGSPGGGIGIKGAGAGSGGGGAGAGTGAGSGGGTGTGSGGGDGDSAIGEVCDGAAGPVTLVSTPMHPTHIAAVSRPTATHCEMRENAVAMMTLLLALGRAGRCRA